MAAQKEGCHRIVIISSRASRINTLRDLSKELTADKEVAIAIVTHNGQEIRFLPKRTRDKEISIAAVTNNGYAIRFLSEELRADKEVCLAAAAQLGTANLSTESESYKVVLKELRYCLNEEQAGELMERLTSCMNENLLP